MWHYYQYQALNLEGKVVTGSKLSVAPILVRWLLLLQRLKPLAIVASLTPVLSKAQRQALFSQLSMLLEANIPLLHAMDFLQANYLNSPVADLVLLIKQQLLKGQAFSAALDSLNLLTKVQLYLLKAGEASGQLNLALKQLVLAHKARTAQQAKWRKALRYPLFLVLAAILVILIFTRYILPQFSLMFGSLGAQLPALTMNILRVTKIIERFSGPSLAALVAAAALSYFNYKTNPKVRFKIDRLLLAWPLARPKINHLVRLKNQQQFFSALALLLNAKVHLLAALELSVPLLPNLCFQRALKEVAKDITGGLDLGGALTKTKLFEEASLQLIRLGEETSNLPALVQQLADLYSAKLSELIARFSSQLEPMILAFLGGTLGILIIGMYLPIFRLGEALH